MPDMVNIPSHPFKSNDEALGALAEVVTWAKEVKARGIDSEIKEATAKVAAEIKEVQDSLRVMRVMEAAKVTSTVKGWIPIVPKRFPVIRDERKEYGSSDNPQDVYEFLMSQRSERGSDLQMYQRLSDVLVLQALAGKVHNRPTSWIADGQIYAEWLNLHKQIFPLRKDDTAMASTVTDKGDEWVPAEVLSSDLLDLVRDASPLAGIFPSFAMTGPIAKRPIKEARSTAYYVGETVHAPHETSWVPYTPSVVTTGQITWTARKLFDRVVIGMELIEDATVDMIAEIRADAAFGIGEGRNQCIVNGDTTGTHQDSDVTGSTDRRKMWNGLRRFCIANSYSRSGGGDALTVADIGAARRAMGKFGGFSAATGGIAALLTSYQAYANLTLDTNVVTLEKYGPGAAILTGEAAKVLGMPMIPTEYMRADLNASGVYDASTTNLTGAILVNVGSWRLGERRIITVKSSDQLYIESDQFVVVASWRGDFQHQRLSTQHTTDYIYNVL